MLKTTNASNTDDIIIAQSTDDSNDIVNCFVTCGPHHNGASDIVDLPAQVSADGVKFDISACVAGDQVELFTNGTQWYGQAFASGTVAILKHDA